MRSAAKDLLSRALVLASLAAPVGATQADETEELIEEFVRAEVEERDELFETLRELVYAEELGMILGRRAERAADMLQRGRTLDRIGKIAESRRRLDELRSSALELILDEEIYFTPYRSPEVSAERAAEYRKVQAEIDELTEEIFELHDSKTRVKLKSRFFEAAQDLVWSIGRRNALGTGEASPEDHDIPAWIEGLGTAAELEELTVRNFAWDAEDRAALDRSALVRRTNEERAALLQKRASSFPEERLPERAEIEQVRVTNEYRTRMGRHALLWNPQLQEATHKHSEYMSRWGILSHYEEKEPDFYDPRKRTRKAGYERGFSENVAQGASGASEVHEAWRHSSGHHRNLLTLRATEMAAARSGEYWTQNFGDRRITDAVLNEWRELPAGPIPDPSDDRPGDSSSRFSPVSSP